MWNSENMKFGEKISDFIARHRLLERDKRYLVALSGGADSVCLLLVLRELGYSVEAAHCNFHLRGGESDRDEAFCESLCLQQNVPFHRTDFDTTDYARRHQISIEMAARELRYNYFNEIIENVGFQGVCVAHHADDNAETILLNLVRGTGLHGLTGMSPRRGRVLRPLLGVGRDEIVDYLRSKGQSYVTDSTNFHTDHVRNKIRLQVIPLLREINPSVVGELNLTARHLADAECVLNDALDRCKADFSADSSENSLFLSRILIPKLLCQPSPAYALFHLLSPCGFNRSQMAEIIGETLEKVQHQDKPSLEDYLACDRESRIVAEGLIGSPTGV